MRRLWGRSALLCAWIVVVSGGWAMPMARLAVGSGTTLYVDGKHGSDADSGLSMSSALKTIAEAARRIPGGDAGAGWTVVIRGYTDYRYRERPIPGGWNRHGLAGAPIRFMAEGYTAGGTGYVRPIVSGSERAPQRGGSWHASTRGGVWWTSWSATPAGFQRGSGLRGTALFQDGLDWLWEQPNLDTLAKRAAKGAGGYWYDAGAKRLYVSGIGPRDPASHEIEVVLRDGFYFKGSLGVHHVQVLGFQVEHTANGIQFSSGADHGVVADNVVNANLFTGIYLAGRQTASGPDPAAWYEIVRNTGRANTVQMIKVSSGATDVRVCDNAAAHNGLQGIKVEGPGPSSGYTGRTARITVCSNALHGQTYKPFAHGWGNPTGLTIANGARSVTVQGNEVWHNLIGIHLTQEGRGLDPLGGIVLRGNRIRDNTRFGLNFFDGLHGSGGGDVTSRHDLIWGNGIGVMVDRGSRNKHLSYDTIYANAGHGMLVAGRNNGARTTVSCTLLTHNRGFGVMVRNGGWATLSHTGVSANDDGQLSGPMSRTAVNHQAAGYLSKLPSSANFLRISHESFQYTAGPSGTPIGARW
jgi:hypothetical protein